MVFRKGSGWLVSDLFGANNALAWYCGATTDAQYSLPLPAKMCRRCREMTLSQAGSSPHVSGIYTNYRFTTRATALQTRKSTAVFIVTMQRGKQKKSNKHYQIPRYAIDINPTRRACCKMMAKSKTDGQGGNPLSSPFHISMYRVRPAERNTEERSVGIKKSQE